MSDRLTPEDADLIAQRIVVRLARFVVALLVTLFGLWLLPVLIATSIRTVGPGSAPLGVADLLLPALSLAVLALLVYVGARYWSQLLRGTSDPRAR